jgi:glycosyltransferase involved in cell wall biosynthesis
MKLIFVLPVYNEEKVLAANTLTLCDFLAVHYPDAEWRIIIADNQSTDATPAIARDLAQRHPQIRYLVVPQRGKGIAIRQAWLSASGDCYAFMDADLATDISAIPALVSGIIDGQCDLVCGSRYHPQSRVARSPIRLLISRGYRLVLRRLLGLRLQDAPCGFKAINERVKTEILPRVENNEWFFDNELAILAEKAGLRVCEIPIIWRENEAHKRKSKVSVLRLSLEYFKKIMALRRRLHNHV